MNDLLIKVLNIKNKEHLKMLRKMSIYYKYGKKDGDEIINSGRYDEITDKDIVYFILEYIKENKILLNYFYRKGLDSKSSMLEFCPSLFFSFQSTKLINDITSIIKYKVPSLEEYNDVIGTIKKSGVYIHDDFDFNASNYDVLLNNSVLDILKNFNGEHDIITDVHGIRFAEDNNMKFFSGYAIRNDNPLREYIIKDFIRSLEKIRVSCDAVVFEKNKEYTLGMAKINEDVE